MIATEGECFQPAKVSATKNHSLDRRFRNSEPLSVERMVITMSETKLLSVAGGLSDAVKAVMCCFLLSGWLLSAQTCDSDARPCINQPHEGDRKVTGKVEVGKDGTPNPGSSVSVKVDGVSYSATPNDKGAFVVSLPDALKDKSSVVAVQEAAKNLQETKAGTTATPPPDNPMFIGIAGVEQSGYSSLGQSTNAFVSGFFRSPAYPVFGLRLWGKVRLLGAPSQSSNGIVSTFTDPTGQLQKTDFTKVGQAIDYVLGAEKPVTDASSRAQISLIGGFGATTPLSSQDVVLTYQVPALGTQECTTLIDRFSEQRGYQPFLAPDPANKTCLAGGYQYFALSNQDRSNFLFKYGAGVRLTSRFDEDDGSKAHGVVDLIVGQDTSVTGGRLHHSVFKVDGMYPLQLKGTSWLYLFGSASMRLAGNRDNAPLILQAATNAPQVPSSSVIVLPLKQSDRDFYRLGVGLNFVEIFKKLGK